MAVVLACALALLGCARAEVPPLVLPTAWDEVVPAPDGAVYRAFYRGSVEAHMESRVRWLDDGTGFELSLLGSGNCPVSPATLEVLEPDHLRIDTERMPGSGGCNEDAADWSFVFDTPSGIDPDLPIRIDIGGEWPAATMELEPVEVRRERLLR